MTMKYDLCVDDDGDGDYCDSYDVDDLCVDDDDDDENGFV
ncbi:hypothetical protein A2U01_0091856, partial [Trifolium medium]|nr:hypothetical protein [Trifolium medium]